MSCIVWFRPSRVTASLALLLVTATVARGQVLRGTVSAEGTNAPLRGAVVTLLDTRGDPVDRRVLTDADGAFAMRAPAAGTWIIEARAIGYSPKRTAARRPSHRCA